MKVIKIAELWQSRDKKGNLLLSGDLNALSKIVVMKNTSKKGDKEPDYYLCIGSKTRKDKDSISLH
jgi:hypothetical protein